MSVTDQYPPQITGARLSGPPTPEFEALATTDESIVYLSGQCHIMPTQSALDFSLSGLIDPPNSPRAGRSHSPPRPRKHKKAAVPRKISENNH